MAENFVSPGLEKAVWFANLMCVIAEGNRDLIHAVDNIILSIIKERNISVIHAQLLTAMAGYPPELSMALTYAAGFPLLIPDELALAWAAWRSEQEKTCSISNNASIEEFDIVPSFLDNRVELRAIANKTYGKTLAHRLSYYKTCKFPAKPVTKEQVFSYFQSIKTRYENSDRPNHWRSVLTVFRDFDCEEEKVEEKWVLIVELLAGATDLIQNLKHFIHHSTCLSKLAWEFMYGKVTTSV